MRASLRPVDLALFLGSQHEAGVGCRLHHLIPPIGLAGGDGGLAQHPGQVAVTVPGGVLAFLRARRLGHDRGEACPGRQVAGGGKDGSEELLLLAVSGHRHQVL